MKKILLTSLVLLFFATTFAQDLKYELNVKKSNPIKKEQLVSAKVMSDIIYGYPTNWILGYVSVNVSGICNGKSVSAKGTNEKLNKEQRAILNTADISTNIDINIEYKCKNPVTGIIELSTMHYKTTHSPDMEAEFANGPKSMLDYLNDQIIAKIPEELAKQLKSAVVNFTINEEGKIDNAKIARTSGDLNTDNLLLEAINKMPNWKPAQNLNGVKVKQNFEFILGSKYIVGGC
jgi:TonB family protein